MFRSVSRFALQSLARFRQTEVLLFPAMTSLSAEPVKGKGGNVFPSSPSQPLSSSGPSSFRIVVVRDIHKDWELEHDYKALQFCRYGVTNMEESVHKIHEAAMGTPEDHSIIFLSHNRPTGLGSNFDDICGKDWEGGGDFGDPDLAQAISLVKETSNYSIPLVVFGHMHKEMVHGGFRKMICGYSNSTMYLNGAIVPRVKPSDSGSSVRMFTVSIFCGKITRVVETWVW